LVVSGKCAPLKKQTFEEFSIMKNVGHDKIYLSIIGGLGLLGSMPAHAIINSSELGSTTLEVDTDHNGAGDLAIYDHGGAGDAGEWFFDAETGFSSRPRTTVGSSTMKHTAGGGLSVTGDGAAGNIHGSGQVRGNTLQADNGLTVSSGMANLNGGLAVGGGTSVNMGGNRVQNIADGIAPADAVNLRQLNAVEGKLDKRINETGAIAAAFAQLGQAQTPGKSTFGIAAGGQGGKSGLAIGFSHRPMSAKPVVIKLSLGASGSTTSGGIGATWEF
jgi:hypothetical protein